MITKTEIKYRVYYNQKGDIVNFYTDAVNEYQEAETLMKCKLEQFDDICNIGIVMETTKSEVIKVVKY